MSYKPKVIKCRLKTGGKTIAEIRERHKGQGLTYRDFEHIQRANEAFDGVILLLSQWGYDKHEDYHLYGWTKEQDEKIMMGMYHAEQTHPFPQYKGKLEEFQKDWKAGKYDPGASFCFDPQDIEEIEVVQGEQK
jgi:hypothetical protein